MSKTKVIGISGGIGSGKTALANEVSEKLGCHKVGFGDYVRSLAEEQGLEPSRENLQTLGEQLVTSNLEEFCTAVLFQKGWKKDSHLVVEGIRHTEVVETIKRVISPVQFELVYINLPLEERKLRLEKRQNIHDAQNIVQYDQHSTEKQTQNELLDVASIFIDGNTPIEQQALEVIEALGDKES
jgi:dephospho-CoA kinase